jgi:predicted Holliday junction resolvase-like endonuclease
MLKGRISGHMGSLFPEVPFSSADARFIGNPIDFVVFLDTLTERTRRGIR